MVDKDELKSFLRFLDEASDRELAERATLYRQMLDLLDAGSDARRDIAFLRRKLIDEQVARLQVRLLEEARKRAS